MPAKHALRSKSGTLCCLFLLMLGVSAALAQEFVGSTSRDLSAGNTALKERDGVNQVLREGTKVENLLGHFETNSDRATFHTADGKHSFDSLENLNLERIVRTLGDNPEKLQKLQWSITGVVTEFQGRNFLRITRAMLKSKTNERDDRRSRRRSTHETDG